MRQQLAKNRLRDVRHGGMAGTYREDVSRNLGAGHVVHHSVTVQGAEPVENGALERFG